MQGEAESAVAGRPATMAAAPLPSAGAVTAGKGKRAKPAAPRPAKSQRPEMVRDSFTMPENEYAVINALKKRCAAAGVPAKKSEILRAAIANLARLSDAALLAAIRRLAVIKTGRPKGSR